MRDYYTALNEQRYDDAWAVLTPAIRSRFGGFEHWKAGDEKTLSSKPKDLVTTLEGDRMVVRLRLAALEEGCPIAPRLRGHVDARARGRRVDRHRAGRSVARCLLCGIEMSITSTLGVILRRLRPIVRLAWLRARGSVPGRCDPSAVRSHARRTTVGFMTTTPGRARF